MEAMRVQQFKLIRHGKRGFISYNERGEVVHKLTIDKKQYPFGKEVVKFRVCDAKCIMALGSLSLPQLEKRYNELMNDAIWKEVLHEGELGVYVRPKFKNSYLMYSWYHNNDIDKMYKYMNKILIIPPNYHKMVVHGEARNILVPRYAVINDEWDYIPAEVYDEICDIHANRSYKSVLMSDIIKCMGIPNNTVFNDEHIQLQKWSMYRWLLSQEYEYLVQTGSIMMLTKIRLLPEDIRMHENGVAIAMRENDIFISQWYEVSTYTASEKKRLDHIWSFIQAGEEELANELLMNKSWRD